MNRELETDTTFPVKNGVEVVVKCKTGYTLTSGDRVLTCETDDRYTFQDSLPVCSIGGNFSSIQEFLFSLCSVLLIIVIHYKLLLITFEP